MQRRRWRTLALLRKLLMCAICAIALVALLSAHVQVFPSSEPSNLSDPYKLPTQHEFKQRLGTERSWTQELTPPHLSKAPLSSRQLGHASEISELYKLWKPPSNRDFVPCAKPSPNYTSPVESQGYLLVHTNGGLNQMRAGICDMVAVARIINATLVIPELDKRSFWQDSSNFSDVFDEDHFINALANDVKVVKKLPKELATATRAVKHFRSWSSMDYYQEEIASMWEDYQVIRAAKSDSRLANNNLPPDIQKLRCRACYEALRFAPQIEAMGKLLVSRMRSYGRYIALHLRYEKDMLAFSGCTHDLSPDEADELRMIRENTAHWKIKEIDSAEQRSKGYCPLTPKEVGIFLKMMSLVSKGLDDVHFLGIYGMGGIGKTTLSKVIYEKVSQQFEASCFIADIKEKTRTLGLVYLQKQLIYEILNEEIKIWNEYGASRVIANRLRNKKAFIVLDDVDSEEQLEALAGSHDWFGQGSIIIITSRDCHLLKKFFDNTEIVKQRSSFNTFEVKVLNDAESLELFSWKAFKKPHPKENYVELSMDIVNYAQGLPLALEVFGSSLFGRTMDAWKSARDLLKTNPNAKILDKLKISFDGLEDLEKELFLDIACFFNGAYVESIIHKLESFGYYPKFMIEVLMDKSLISISWEGKFWMHDLLQKMGQKIVDDKSKEPGGCSRLWRYEDVLHVLKNNTGTDAVEGIVLKLPLQKQERLNVEAFSKMTNLKMLEISSNIYEARDTLRTLEWHGDLSNCMLSNELCVMEWWGYPFESLPTSFQSDNLVELRMPFSCIKQPFDGRKSFDKLKRIALSCCKNLIETPDFNGVSNLEELILDNCTSLSKLHPSIGFLRQLKGLNLQGCKRIKRLPDEICLESIQYLNLNGCSRLNKFPDSVGNMTSLRWLYLARTAIKKLPLSLKSLSSLVSLDLSDCSRLEKIPKNLISGMKCLEFLYVAGRNTRKFPLGSGSLWILNSFSGLSSLKILHLSYQNLSDGAIPSDFCCLSSLEDLNLSGNKFTRIPESVWQLSSLIRLDLSYCNLLDEAIPNDLSCLSSLWELNLSGNKFTRIPESVRQHSSLKWLDLSYCNLLDGAIPNDLSCLSSLYILKLSGNRFTRISDSVAQLSHLEQLDLKDCSWLQELPKLPLRLKFLNVRNCPSLELFYNQMDNDCSFVATYIDYDGKSYKILHLHPRSSLWTLNSSCYESMMACGPALGSGIAEWFNDKSGTNSSGIIQMQIDEWGALALFIVYQVHEPDTYRRKRRKRKRKVHEHGNLNSRTIDGHDPNFPYFVCQFQANEVDLGEPLILHAPEVPSVGLSAFWVYIPRRWFCTRAFNSLGGRSKLHSTTKASITTGSLNVEVKECGVRVVRPNNTLEFLQVLNYYPSYYPSYPYLNVLGPIISNGVPSGSIGSVNGQDLLKTKNKKKGLNLPLWESPFPSQRIG